MPAKLPESLFRPPDRYLRDLRIGERAEVEWTGLFVDKDGSCYLKPDAQVLPKSGSLFAIGVVFDEQGYHVKVTHKPGMPKMTWERRDRQLFKGELYAVESFTEHVD
jgi:hypothetical protein